MHFNYYLNITNILITVPNILIFPFLIKRLWKVKSVCHENFWICLLTFEIILICISLSSALLAVGEILSKISPTSSITVAVLLGGTVTSATCNGSLTVCLAILAGERLIATINYKNYETKKYRKFMGGCVFGIIFAGIIDCYFWVFKGIDYFLASFIIYGLQLCASLLMFISFFYNNKLRILTSRSNFILTHRYQIYENLRMIRFITPLMAHNVGGLIFSGGFTMLLRFYFFYPTMTLEMTNSIYFTSCNFFIFTSFLHMHLSRNSNNKNNLSFFHMFQILVTRKKRIVPSSVSAFQPIQWKNALGKNIAKLSYKNETELYFAQVQKVW